MTEPIILTVESRLELDPYVLDLVLGVKQAIGTEITDLEGDDNGLYAALCEVSRIRGETVEDDDELTKDILHSGRRGLRKEFAMGMVTMVKQGPHKRMAATLAHELAHRDAPDIYDWKGCVLSETIAEGATHVVLRKFGLDPSPQTLPYIAGYNEGVFTEEMMNGIYRASENLVRDLTTVAN